MISFMLALLIHSTKLKFEEGVPLALKVLHFSFQLFYCENEDLFALHRITLYP